MNNIKKITLAILIGTLALCLFGCGGGEKIDESKLSTFEEVKTELDTRFTEIEVNGVKDDFAEVCVYEKTPEIDEYGMIECEDYTTKKAFSIFAPSVMVIKTEELGTEQEWKNEFGNKPMPEVIIMPGIKYQLGYGLEMITIESARLSDGENVVNFDASCDDWDTGTLGTMGSFGTCSISTFEDSEQSEIFAKILYSEKPLKIRLMCNSYSTIQNFDFVLDDETKKDFIDTWTIYQDLKEKCNSEKICFQI